MPWLCLPGRKKRARPLFVQSANRLPHAARDVREAVGFPIAGGVPCAPHPKAARTGGGTAVPAPGRRTGAAVPAVPAPCYTSTLRSLPMPSISTTTSSPGLSQGFLSGSSFMPLMTPAQVPVKIKSPGFMVTNWEM